MGFGSIEALTEVAAAIAVILSALVSLIGTSGRENTVRMGQARMAELCELTGILEPKMLQDVFGPPTMNGVWPTVTLERIAKARTPAGYLLSDSRVDYACIAAAIAALATNHWITNVLLAVAVGVQAAGWVISSRLPYSGQG